MKFEIDRKDSLEKYSDYFKRRGEARGKKLGKITLAFPMPRKDFEEFKRRGYHIKADRNNRPYSWNGYEYHLEWTK